MKTFPERSDRCLPPRKTAATSRVFCADASQIAPAAKRFAASPRVSRPACAGAHPSVFYSNSDQTADQGLRPIAFAPSGGVARTAALHSTCTGRWAALVPEASGGRVRAPAP